MKKSIFTFLLMLGAMGSWAQIANDSTCVFEGNISNVPDGCPIYICTPYPEYGPNGYRPDSVTIVKDGKFRFEKVINTGNWCFLGIGKYGQGPTISISPGMKTVVTGDGSDPWSLTFTNDHPNQKETNIYEEFKKEKLADYLDLSKQRRRINLKIYEASTEEERKKIREEERKFDKENLRPLRPKYFKIMYEFIKDRDFSNAFEMETATLTNIAFQNDNKEDMDKCRELFAKFPKDHMSQQVYSIKEQLYPKYQVLKAGDQAKDYTLRDHDDKPHSILETLGKGKYLLLETVRRGCERSVLDRQKEFLKELVAKYSDKFDIISISISMKDMFYSKEWQAEDWLELSLNETTPFEEIMGTYFPKDERFIFISPEGKILGKCDEEHMPTEFKKHFPFAR